MELGRKARCECYVPGTEPVQPLVSKGWWPWVLHSFAYCYSNILLFLFFFFFFLFAEGTGLAAHMEVLIIIPKQL